MTGVFADIHGHHYWVCGGCHGDVKVEVDSRSKSGLGSGLFCGFGVRFWVWIGSGRIQKSTDSYSVGLPTGSKFNKKTSVLAQRYLQTHTMDTSTGF